MASRYAHLVYGLVVSVMALAIWLPMQAAPSAAATPMGDTAAITEAVERFAPQVRLHPEERYFPSSVSWYLERAEVHSEAHGAIGDLPTLMATTRQSAPQDTGETIATKVEDTLKETLRETSLGRHFLKINQAHPHDEMEARRGELKSAKTYVHVREPARGAAGLDIQYWFFYPYSGPVLAGPAGGAHEGDWEHITVRLDPSLQRVEKVFFAAHDREGTWVSAEGVEFVEKTHPVVYSARYGHASYPSAGIQSRGMLPADRTADGGESWDTWGAVEIIGDPSGPRQDLAWMDFDGRWGKTGVLFSGPRGPAFQRYWNSEI